MLMEPSEITTSIRPYDSETADHLEFIGFKMNADLVKHIRLTVDPIREKMINEISIMIADNHKEMLDRAGKAISRRYRNAVRNSIEHMNYKKAKSGESKLKIVRGADGKITCIPIKPSKPLSKSKQSFRIDSKLDQSTHTQTHNDSNANQSEQQHPRNDSHHDQREQPQTCNDSQTHAYSHTDPPPYCANDDDDVDSEAMDLTTKKELPQPRTSTPTDLTHPTPSLSPTPGFNIKNPDPALGDAREQCKQNAALPDLDFKDTPLHSYAAIHDYLKKCNCPTCIKNLFNVHINANESKKCRCFNPSKCACSTCRPYLFYEAKQIDIVRDNM